MFDMKGGVVATSTPMASMEELLEFANKIREAGGANPIQALVPAQPGTPKHCLIAKALNFDCEVNGKVFPAKWYMIVKTKKVRDQIAEALGLEISEDQRKQGGSWGPAVYLPDGIGAIAREFDLALDGAFIPKYNSSTNRYENVLNKKDRVAMNRLKKMWPYIDESIREQYDLAGLEIEPDGTVVVKP